MFFTVFFGNLEGAGTINSPTQDAAKSPILLGLNDIFNNNLQNVLQNFSLQIYYNANISTYEISWSHDIFSL